MVYKYSRGKTKYYNKKKKSDHTKLVSLSRKVALFTPEVKEKYFTRVYAASTISSTFTPLNILSQGTANGLRLGNQVRLKSMTLNLLANIETKDILVGTDSTQTAWTLTGTIGELRVIIFCNNQNNNSNTSTLSEILRYAGSSRAAISSVYNLDFVGYKRQYKILYDKYFALSNMAAPHFRNLKVTIPLKYVVNFSSNAGDSTDIIDKDIRILIISNSVQVNYQWAVRLRYTDV